MSKFFSIKKEFLPAQGCMRTTVYILGIKIRRTTQSVNAAHYGIQIQIAYAYSGESALEHKFINSMEEHEENVQRLKHGLSEEALLNLEQILIRKDKIVALAKANIFIKDEDVYNKEELKTLLEVRKIGSEVSQVADYYQYKDYKLPVKSFSASVFYHKHGLQKLKTFTQIGEKCILDVGSCLGDSILVFREACSNAIIGFEPVKQTHQEAIKTMELCGISNVIIENMGLGDKIENAMINATPDNAHMSSLFAQPQGSIKEEIQVTTLDEYVGSNNIEVGLIKVDVEGFEPNFLEGAINTIKSQKPILLLSIYHCYNDFYKIKPWLEELNLGYKFDFFKGIDGDPVCETLLLCEVY